MGYKRQHPEATAQQQVFEWALINRHKWPDLDMMFHIPNGGSRHPIEAANLKRQGVKAGVPDIFLPVPRKIYHGLFIEMKAGKNKTTTAQDGWIDALLAQGYAVAVCRGFDNAIAIIIEYLNL